jgi:tetratricopeptide (TPR) repeat protein
MIALTEEARARLKPVGDAIRAGDVETARRLAPPLLDAGIEHPLLLNLRAMNHEAAERYDLALKDLQRAHLLAPEDASTLNACGLNLLRLGRAEEALSCYDRALALAPEYAGAWYNRGGVLEHLGRKSEAVRSYEEAVRLQPEHALAWAGLAFLASVRGDAKAALEHSAKALALDPDNITARLAEAQAWMSEPRRAVELLRAILESNPDPGATALAESLLADAYDDLGEVQAATATYQRANKRFRDHHAPQFAAEGLNTPTGAIQVLANWAEAVDASKWGRRLKGEASGLGERAHVFLFGFPRSGTTLMETMLANHPDVVSLEERNTFASPTAAFLTSRQGLDRLTEADDAGLRRYRSDYWGVVKRWAVEPGAKVFIDKNPFNTTRMGLIFKMFPNAKVIFAVRDPRDVVLSCWRRRFVLNPSTYEFLDLSQTALAYDATMRFAEAIRPKQDLAEHRLAYERLVADFRGEAERVCDFLGIVWRDDLADIASRAKRGEIGSASAAQISRGLYDGAGSWRRYAELLEPVRPILDPWVEMFGYDL